MDGSQQLVALSVSHKEAKINFNMLMALIDGNIHNKYPSGEKKKSLAHPCDRGVKGVNDDHNYKMQCGQLV